jgi:hypothetical protein
MCTIDEQRTIENQQSRQKSRRDGAIAVVKKRRIGFRAKYRAKMA